jgi:hypothetical protein
LFLSLFRFPVYTTELTDLVYKKLFRVFDGRNPVFDYNFKVKGHGADWSEYNDNKFWESKGWQTFKNRLNSLLIIDLPSEQEGNKPDPYKFVLSIDDVIDLKVDKDRKVEYVIFRPSGDNKKLAVYDNEFYYIFQTKENDTEILSTLVENKHELGYCPASFFWHKEFSPLTPYLSALDWLLFFGISKKQLDLFGS